MEAEAATCGDDPGVRGRRAEVARGEERKRGGARNRDGGGDSGNGWSSGDPKERAGRRRRYRHGRVSLAAELASVPCLAFLCGLSDKTYCGHAQCYCIC
jgi:hypothetical protein